MRYQNRVTRTYSDMLILMAVEGIERTNGESWLRVERTVVCRRDGEGRAGMKSASLRSRGDSVWVW